MLRPDFDTFIRLAREGGLVVASREVPFDTETAVTAYAKLARPPFSFLLESATGGETWARWTFLGTEPREAWRLAGGALSRWTPKAGWSTPVATPDPLAELDARLRASRPVTMPGMPRFFGGAVGYLGYDVVRTLERLAPPAELGPDCPDGILLWTDTVLAIDNLYGRAHALATIDVTGAPEEAVLRRLYDDAAARIDELLGRLEDQPGPAPLRLTDRPRQVPFGSSFDRAGFEAAVQRAQEYIEAGDVFQVVLSQQLDVPLDAPPLELYRALRSLNPSPYMYLLELDDVALVGSSPEVLVRVEDGTVTVRPIAGTRPRAAGEEEDQARARDLLADPKERAEHLMLVDLGRNDVGRVAEYGSIRVPDLMTVERYSHVWHMVSRVEGRLRAGLSAVDALRATFPAGTVSGAPKIRAMEIIDELEPVRRGAYAGAVGYFCYGGDAMDTAIAIRTLMAAGGRALVQAGAGIVADSDPGREYEETLAKAGALLAVLGSLGGST